MNNNESRADELFRALVGRRTGIIRQISLVDPIDGDASLYFSGAQIANAHPYHGEHKGLGVGGSGTSACDALLGALCEGVERYVASSYGPDSVGLRSIEELGRAHFIDPRDLCCFTASQRAEHDFPFAQCTESTILRWVMGRDLFSDNPCWVPAFSVYLPYMLEEHEPLLGMGLSTGLSCASTLDEAIIKGVYECIERDSMALVWVNGLSVPKLDQSLVKKTIGALLPPRDHWEVFELTSDMSLPVYLVCCFGEGPYGPIVSIGAACHCIASKALEKAAIEASQDRVYVRLLIDQDKEWRPNRYFSNVTDFSLHARLYSHNKSLISQGFAFLKPTPRVVTAINDQSDFDISALKKHLRSRGMRGAWVDLTPPWAKTMGLYVVRVVLPDLMPLHGNHSLRFLSHPRLVNYATAFPSGVKNHSHSFWPYPHPMP